MKLQENITKDKAADFRVGSKVIFSGMIAKIVESKEETCMIDSNSLGTMSVDKEYLEQLYIDSNKRYMVDFREYERLLSGKY